MPVKEQENNLLFVGLTHSSLLFVYHFGYSSFTTNTKNTDGEEEEFCLFVMSFVIRVVLYLFAQIAVTILCVVAQQLQQQQQHLNLFPPEKEKEKVVKKTA